MTTTEWVERYNQAYEQADWSARFWDRRLRTYSDMYLELQTHKEAERRWLEENSTMPCEKEDSYELPTAADYYAMSNPYKKCFKSKDVFLNVTGRGDIFLVDIPVRFPLPIPGEIVEIDGRDRTINFVEVMLNSFGRRDCVGLVVNPIPPNPLTWYCPESGYWMINGEMIYLTKGEQRVFLANPSPFEPKEVVDDGQEGTGALNRKE